MSGNGELKVICSGCSTEFTYTNKNRKYCYKNILTRCKYCLVKFETICTNKSRKFCSDKCQRSQARDNLKSIKEDLRKLSLKRNGSTLISDSEMLELWDYKKNKENPKDYSIKSSSKEFWWKCKNNHSWKSTPKHLVLKDGVIKKCAFCSGRKTKLLKGVNDLKTTHPDVVEKNWDYSKNDFLPDSIKSNFREKVWWLCHKHQTSWSAAPRNVVSGTSIPICCRKYSSFLEEEVYSFLKENYDGIIVRRSKILKNNKGKVYELDFLLPELSLAFEVQDFTTHSKTRDDEISEYRKSQLGLFYKRGPIEHELKRTLARDGYNIRLIDIWEDEIRNGGFTEILKKELNLEEKIKVHPRMRKIVENHNKVLQFLVNKDDLNGAKKETILQAKCPVGHNFSSTLKALKVYKTPCPYCAGRKILIGFNDISSHEKSKNFSKTNVFLPTEIRARDASFKVVWVHEDHTFEMTPYNHLISNHNCNKCFGSVFDAKVNSVKAKLPVLSKYWSSNNILDSSEVRFASKEEFLWNCSMCGTEHLRKNPRYNNDVLCKKCSQMKK